MNFETKKFNNLLSFFNKHSQTSVSFYVKFNHFIYIFTLNLLIQSPNRHTNTPDPNENGDAAFGALVIIRMGYYLRYDNSFLDVLNYTALEFTMPQRYFPDNFILLAY